MSMSANDLHFNPERILADWDTLSANFLHELEVLKRNTTYQEGLRRGHPHARDPRPESFPVHSTGLAGA
jgi:hypothetical protein